jgi:signal transduction histidine kinase
VKVLADPDRVGEALDQLLANSLHHCQPGDRVSIAVSRHGLSAELAVTDTGSGFDPADAEKLFQRFYRADPALANPTGSGIGLTVARALIQAQGGTLTARSPGKGAGATFTIGLPASEG